MDEQVKSIKSGPSVDTLTNTSDVNEIGVDILSNIVTSEVNKTVTFSVIKSEANEVAADAISNFSDSKMCKTKDEIIPFNEIKKESKSDRESDHDIVTFTVENSTDSIIPQNINEKEKCCIKDQDKTFSDADVKIQEIKKKKFIKRLDEVLQPESRVVEAETDIDKLGTGSKLRADDADTKNVLSNSDTSATKTLSQLLKNFTRHKKTLRNIPVDTRITDIACIKFDSPEDNMLCGEVAVGNKQLEDKSMVICSDSNKRDTLESPVDHIYSRRLEPISPNIDHSYTASPDLSLNTDHCYTTSLDHPTVNLKEASNTTKSSKKDTLKTIIVTSNKKCISKSDNETLNVTNCRVTNQPDWGDVYICIDGDKTITPESLAKYIVSHRQVSHFHEEICEMIFKHIYDVVNLKR